MKCSGLHCPGCGDSGGGLLVALVVIGAVIHAIWHALVEAAEIAALTLLSAAGLAAVAGLVYTAVRIRARAVASRERQTIPARAEVIRLGAVPEHDAIKPPRVYLNVTPEQLAAILRHPADEQ